MAGMTKESIQLKNVKIAWHMSEGTTAFTASLYIDGKKAADVKNEGRGGDNHPRFMDRELEKEFHEFCKSLPPRDYGMDADGAFNETYPMNYDSFIGDLLTEWISNDDWKKACKKGIAYTLTSHKDGEYMLWKVPYSPTMAEQVRKQYSETGNLKEIINERFI
jgi:hypothetical protein